MSTAVSEPGSCLGWDRMFLSVLREVQEGFVHWTRSKYLSNLHTSYSTFLGPWPESYR